MGAGEAGEENPALTELATGDVPAGIISFTEVTLSVAGMMGGAGEDPRCSTRRE